MSDCEELVGLLTGENGDEMLISAFRSRKSISGPELESQPTYGRAVHVLQFYVINVNKGSSDRLFFRIEDRCLDGQGK